MNGENKRWVLAFDASCGTCRQISAVVAKASDGRLEIMPLTQTDVQRWRAAAMGADAPLAPTLLRIYGSEVRAWTGVNLALPLARQLGLRPTLRVLRSLGQLKRQASGHPLDHVETDGIGRKAFLRLGAGAALAAGLAVTGKMPAFAEKTRDAAQAWVDANKGTLPQSYDALCDYPMAYRRAIYAEWSPQAKSRFWLEHMKRYRAAHPELTARQLEVLKDASAVAAQPSTFDGVQSPHKEVATERLKNAAIREFGTNESVLLFATLGPSDLPASARSAPMSGCICNQADDWCGWGYHCRPGPCDTSSSGCGWWGGQQCNGLCYD